MNRINPVKSAVTLAIFYAIVACNLQENYYAISQYCVELLQIVCNNCIKKLLVWLKL